MRSARATPRRAPTTRAQGGAARRRRPIASRPSRRAQERSRPPRRRARGDAHPSLAAVARLGPYRRRRAHDGSVEISEHAFSERLLRARTRSAACCAPVPCNLKMIVLFESAVCVRKLPSAVDPRADTARRHVLSGSIVAPDTMSVDALLADLPPASALERSLPYLPERSLPLCNLRCAACLAASHHRDGIGNEDDL